MAKGKVSKNSRTSKNKVIEYIKPQKPRKETILVEITAEVMCEIGKNTNTETGLVESYLGKPILKIVSKFGKNYLLLQNI